MRNNKGFTLIELLIVVVIIGILAAIAIPKFSATREKAYYSALKSDMKNLASQQEIYYADHYTYNATAANLGFVSSEGVTITMAAGSSTWQATGTHSGLATTEGCAIFYGDFASAPSLTPGSPGSPGEVACTD